jgi:hypothetical protein
VAVARPNAVLVMLIGEILNLKEAEGDDKGTY